MGTIRSVCLFWVGGREEFVLATIYWVYSHQAHTRMHTDRNMHARVSVPIRHKRASTVKPTTCLCSEHMEDLGEQVALAPPSLSTRYLAPTLSPRLSFPGTLGRKISGEKHVTSHCEVNIYCTIK